MNCNILVFIKKTVVLFLILTLQNVRKKVEVLDHT